MADITPEEISKMKAAGYSEEEIMQAAGYSPEEIKGVLSPKGLTQIEQSQTGTGILANLVGASKGYLKGIPSALTAPADLLVRGANAGIRALGGPLIENESEFYPSNLVGEAVDWLSGNTPSNPTAEKIGNVVGTVASMVAGLPSATGAAMKATAPVKTSLPAIVGEGAQYASRGLPMLPRAAVVGTVGAAEGALTNAALAAKDPNANLNDAAKQGAKWGGALAAAGPIVSEVASDASNFLSNASDRAFERSLGATSKDFVRSQKISGSYTDVDSGVLETRLSNAFKGVREQDVIPTIGTKAGKASIVIDTKKAIGGSIGSVISDIDKAGITPEVTFGNLDELVANTPFPRRADVRAQVEAVKNTLKDWNGSAIDLHSGKSVLGTLGYSTAPGVSPTAISGEVARAAERDFRAALHNALQSGIDSGAIFPERMQQFLSLNEKYGNLAKVAEVISPAAIAAQHANNPGLRRLGSFASQVGIPMAYGYAKGGIPGAIVGGSLGLLERTSSGQAIESALEAGGASALRLLDEIANNPYAVRGLSVAGLPRNWEDIKENHAAKMTIAAKSGVSIEDFISLPEPLQKELHAQVILSDPKSAEPAPRNYSLVNGKFTNPIEKDSYLKEQDTKPLRVRSKTIPGIFENKFVPEVPISPPPKLPPALPATVEKLNEALSSNPVPETPSTDASYDDSTLGMLEALTKSQMLNSGGYN